MLTQMYSCNATDSEEPVEDVDCESNPVLVSGIFLEAEFDNNKQITNLRFEILQLEAALEFSLEEIAQLEFDEVLRIGYSTVKTFDDTSCPDGFSFIFAKKSILAFDVWRLRCNNWMMTGFVLAGSLEVVRQAAASQGVQCGEFESTDINHDMGSRGVKGHWALTGESIRAIDDGLTLLFVGQGLGGLENVGAAMGAIDVGDDDEENFLDPLLEISFDGFNGTILNGTERSCFVGGGADSITIEEANEHPSIRNMTESTTLQQQIFAFATFTWVTETTPYSSGFTVAEPRDGAAPFLARTSRVVLILCGAWFAVFICVSLAFCKLRLPQGVNDMSMFEQFAALMTVSAELAIISGSGGAAGSSVVALILTVVHGCTLILYVLISLPECRAA